MAGLVAYFLSAVNPKPTPAEMVKKIQELSTKDALSDIRKLTLPQLTFVRAHFGGFNSRWYRQLLGVQRLRSIERPIANRLYTNHVIHYHTVPYIPRQVNNPTIHHFLGYLLISTAVGKVPCLPEI